MQDNEIKTKGVEKPERDATPEWAAPRSDDAGATHALDCSRQSARGGAARPEFVNALKTVRDKGFRSLLLYGFFGWSKCGVIDAIRAATGSGFSSVKLELPITAFDNGAFYERILQEGATTVFIVMPSHGTGSENKRAIIALDGITKRFKEAGLGDALRVKTTDEVPVANCIETLKTLALAGAGYIIAYVEDGGYADFAKLERSVKAFVEEADVTVELRRGAALNVYRAPALRAKEARDLLLDVPHYFLGGKPIPLGAVFQLNFRCNQKCVFCTSDKSLPMLKKSEALSVLRRTLRSRIPRVVFTGGEPTLDKALAEYVEICRAEGVLETSLYTNGMALASREYAGRLARAGLDLALISLHASTPKASDAITRRRGGFKRTTQGIENITRERVFTIINYVINAKNYRETSAFVEFVARRFPGVGVNFSCVAPVVKETAVKGTIPCFRDVAPSLRDALDACDELGVLVAGLEPHWGIPPCAAGADRRYYPFLFPISTEFSGFVKSASCDACVLNDSCPGVRKHYAGLYGLDEIGPVT